MFEGPLLLCLQKSANLCCEYVDQPLFCHSIPSQLAQSFFYSKPHPRYEIPAPSGQACMCCSLRSRLPLSFIISPPPQSRGIVWNSCPAHLMSLDWLFFPCFKKVRKHLLNDLGFLSVVVTFLYSQLKSLQEKPLLFCVLSSPSWQLCCS